MFNWVGEALAVFVLFAGSYLWNARRGFWLTLSRWDLPRELYFVVWYAPGLWSWGSLGLLIFQAILVNVFGFGTPSWLWALSLGGTIGLVDSLINP